MSLQGCGNHWKNRWRMWQRGWNGQLEDSEALCSNARTLFTSNAQMPEDGKNSLYLLTYNFVLKLSVDTHAHKTHNT